MKQELRTAFHDISNQLSIAEGLCRLLARDLVDAGVSDKPKIKERLDNMVQAIAKMKIIVQKSKQDLME